MWWLIFGMEESYKGQSRSPLQVLQFICQLLRITLIVKSSNLFALFQIIYKVSVLILIISERTRRVTTITDSERWYLQIRELHFYSQIATKTLMSNMSIIIFKKLQNYSLQGSGWQSWNLKILYFPLKIFLTWRK